MCDLCSGDPYAEVGSVFPHAQTVGVVFLSVPPPSATALRSSMLWDFRCWMVVDFHVCWMSLSLFWGCGLLLSSTVCLWLRKYPIFGLQLSFFGHVRAKNNSVLPYGFELCSSSVWDYPWFPSCLHGVVKGLLCRWYAVVVPWNELAWLV